MRRRLFSRSGPQRTGLDTGALAPLVDLLTLLLVAVLRTWSADPPPDLAEDGFELPVTREESPVPRVVTIDIGQGGLYVDGWRAGNAAYWTEAEALLITDLYGPLQQAGSGSAVVRAHAEAPWSLVGKVLLTAQQAGYTDISLVAESRASL
jgi:biopolymer transport protein ExbD